LLYFGAKKSEKNDVFLHFVKNAPIFARTRAANSVNAHVAASQTRRKYAHSYKQRQQRAGYFA
jgi:hypothetical protein